RRISSQKKPVQNKAAMLGSSSGISTSAGRDSWIPPAAMTRKQKLRLPASALARPRCWSDPSTSELEKIDCQPLSFPSKAGSGYPATRRTPPGAVAPCMQAAALVQLVVMKNCIAAVDRVANACGKSSYLSVAATPQFSAHHTPIESKREVPLPLR
nr:hypothetical protein [Tanacetum cinerariifolium]